MAIIAANLQVLTASIVFGFPEPVPQGTIIFTTTFLANNLLTEFYGPDSAKRAVWLGFFSTVVLSCFMYITIATRPAMIASTSPDYHFTEAYLAITTLFTPSAAIFVASILAYVISQYSDIYIYQKLKQRTQGKMLWLRGLLANALSAFIDNSIFSILVAFFVFGISDMALDHIALRYIFGTYWLRLIASFCNIPILYLAKYLTRASHNKLSQ
jgi:uncharacterized integral membrane protein (TIGR00697 family)